MDTKPGTPATVKERLRLFISTLGISERHFCERIGVGHAFVASIKKSMKADKLQSITRLYPELNPIWLMRGLGDMYSGAPPLPHNYQPLKPETPEAAAPLPSEVLLQLLDEAKAEKARLLDIIEKQQATISDLSAALASQKVTHNVRPVGAVCNADAG